jgi:hypothetical protein
VKVSFFVRNGKLSWMKNAIFLDGFHEKDENEYSFNLYIGVFQISFSKRNY